MTCSENDRASELFKSEPKLIIEVLSKSTEGVDRGIKSERYRSLPSLEEYVIVDPRRACVEVQRRAGELWTLHGHYDRNDSAELSSVGLQLALQDVYEEVVFPDLQALIAEMERDAAAEDPDAK